MPGPHPLAVTTQLPATPATVAKGKRELGAILIIALLGFSALAATVMVQLDIETRRLESENTGLRVQFADARNPTTPVGPNQLCTLYPAGGALYVGGLLEKSPYNTTATMLVDTGADISLAPARLATDLQINLYSGTQITLRGLFGGRRNSLCPQRQFQTRKPPNSSDADCDSYNRFCTIRLGTGGISRAV